MPRPRGRLSTTSTKSRAHSIRTSSSSSPPSSDGESHGLWHRYRDPPPIYLTAPSTLPQRGCLSATILDRYYVDRDNELMGANNRPGGMPGGRPIYIVRIEWMPEEVARSGNKEIVEEEHVAVSAILSWVSRREFERFEGEIVFREMDAWRAEVRADAERRVEEGRKYMRRFKKEDGDAKVRRRGRVGRPKGSRIVGGMLVTPTMRGESGRSDEEIDTGNNGEEDEDSGVMMEEEPEPEPLENSDEGDTLMAMGEEELDVVKTGVYGHVDRRFDDEMVQDKREPSMLKFKRPRIKLESPIPDRNRNGKKILRARSSSSESLSHHIFRRKSNKPIYISEGTTNLASNNSASVSESSSELQLLADSRRKRNAASESSSNKKLRTSTGLSMTVSGRAASRSLTPNNQRAEVVEEDADVDEDGESVEEDPISAEAERIINVRLSNGRRQYLVKWVQPEGDITWEDEENLQNAEELIASFYAEAN